MKEEGNFSSVMGAIRGAIYVANWLTGNIVTVQIA